MRIFSAAVLVLLTGCEAKPVAESKVAMAQPENRIECATGDAKHFAEDCAIERGVGNALILRHGDGGFRRLTLDADGTIDTADGAETVDVKSMSDGRAEITVGKDSYRLPPKL
jgi:hypothetical protein